MAKRKRTQAEKDRAFAQKYAKGLASPYRTAATAAETDAARGMTDAQIAELYGAGYGAAGGIAGMIGGAAGTGAANASSILSGLVGALPGAGSYDVTSLLADYTGANAANADLGRMYGASLAADIGTAAASGLSVARGRRDERSDRLNAEARALQMQGDVAASDYLTPLNNILATRGARQNLALAKFQFEQAKKDAANRGRGGSGGTNGGGEDTVAGGSTFFRDRLGAPGQDLTEAQAKEIVQQGAKDSIYGLDGLISSTPTTQRPRPQAPGRPVR
jgi:hypothetical protein